jgi:hypothetical protein
VTFHGTGKQASGIGSWTPWVRINGAAGRRAIRLAAGSHIVADVHYQPAKESRHGTRDLSVCSLPTNLRPRAFPISCSKRKADAAQRFRAENRLAADNAPHCASARDRAWCEVRPRCRRKSGRKARNSAVTQKIFSHDWPTPYILKEPVLLVAELCFRFVAYGGPVKLTVQPILGVEW